MDGWTSPFMEELLKVLGTGGVAGGVLAWFLWRIVPEWDKFKAAFFAALSELRAETRSENARLEARVERMEAAMDRLSKVELVRLVASPHVSDPVKETAAAMLEDVKTAIADHRPVVTPAAPDTKP